MSLYEDRFRQAGNYSLPVTPIENTFEEPYFKDTVNSFNDNLSYYYNPDWAPFTQSGSQATNKNNKSFNWANLIGPVGAGIAAATQSPGTYYVQANWKGGGLANTGLGYTANPNYANPYDVGQMLSSLADLKGWSLTKDNLTNGYNNVLNRLSELGTDLRNRQINNKYGTRGNFPMDIA